MGEISILTWVAAEIALALLVVCGFLFAHAGSLKKLIAALEKKVIDLRAEVKSARQESKSTKANVTKPLSARANKSWTDLLAEEIDKTRNYHAGLNPDRDIVLDITADAPLERQAVSLRHAFLIAEQEAWHAGDDTSADWDVLQGKLSQIIQFFADSKVNDESAVGGDSGESSAETHEQLAQAAQEIDNYKRRIENLERFKKLCFDMEKKWEQASAQATEYEKELLLMGQQLGAGEDFETILAKYGDVYSELGETIQDSTGGDALTSGENRPAVLEQVVVGAAASGDNVGRMVIANQEEVQRLRNMAVDQHKVIVELKKKLASAKSAEEKDAVIEELRVQLDRQVRFLKESDQCTQLLEAELSTILRDNIDLQDKLKDLQQQVAELQETHSSDANTAPAVAELENLIADLTTESRDMLNTIARLEAENGKLMLQLEQRPGGAGVADDAQVKQLKSRLAEVQQELLNLQTQHIELEERYLELKMQ